ncbi:hypothetical protein [Brachybacterium sp. GPGPB12]|uniref:hypothetical protein n=1 Tax=Brachybacterium sp. GPGPB12 TaxID=3023517 RepID=UPI00313427B5
MPRPQNSPYIAFPGNGQEVLTHWQELFGGELEMMTYDEIPDLSGFPFTPPRGAVAHATLTGGLFAVSGGDAIGGPGDERRRWARTSTPSSSGSRTRSRRRTSSHGSPRAAGRSRCPSSSHPGATTTARSSTASA